MSNLVRQMLVLLSSKAVTRCAQFVTFVLLARLLSPEDFGWFGMITTAIALGAMVGSLGLRQAVAHELGQERISAKAASHLAIVVPLPLGLLAGAIVGVWIFSRDVGGESAALAWIAGIGVAGTIGLLIFQGINLGSGDITKFSVSEAVPPIVLLFTIFSFYLLGEVTLDVSVASYALGFVVVSLTLFLSSVSRGLKSSYLEINVSRLLKYGLVFALNLTLITLAPRISMFVLEANYGAGMAGHFYGAVRISEMFLEVTAAMAMVLFSDAARSRDREVKIARNAQIAAWLFWVFLPVGGALALAAPWLVPFILGQEYASAIPALQILALGMGSAAGSRIIYITFAAYGKPHVGLPLILMSVTLNVGLSILWVPALGIEGGAWALVAGQIALYGSYIAVCHRRGVASWRQLIVPSRQVLGPKNGGDAA